MRGHACRGEAPPLPAALVSRDQQTADRGPPLFIFVGDTCTRIVVKRERTRAEGALHGAISDLLHSHDWIHAAWVVRSRGVISFPVWRMLAPGPAVRCVSTADTKLRCPSYAVRSFSRQWLWQWSCLACSSSTFCGPLDIQGARPAIELLTKDEARRIAANVTKLLELVDTEGLSAYRIHRCEHRHSSCIGC
jgi:hypothetical protein